MTNGEKLCIDFPNMRYTISGHRVITTIGIAASFDLDWWNAEYKEPTTKNDLGVDTDKLIADCEKMSFDFELFGRPTKALLLDAVKNIVKELSSATPQEPRCKDCKWWKDSDGKYRRGIEAESKCPINTHVVYCGEGYCYMFSQKDMSEVEE